MVNGDGKVGQPHPDCKRLICRFARLPEKSFYSPFTTYFWRTPKLWNPGRISGFFDDSTPELTPVQPISPDSLPYSILGQRFITTLMPAASARAAASSWR